MDQNRQRDQSTVVQDAAKRIRDLLSDIGSSKLRHLVKKDLKESLRSAAESLSELIDGDDDRDTGVLSQQPPDGTFLANGGWTNWSSSVKPRVLPQPSRPTTIQEVQATVTAAAKSNKRVRCVSQGHSWSPVFFDEGTSHVLFMGDLVLNAAGDRILIERTADATTGSPARVRVAPGVTTGELGQWFEEHAAKIGCTGLSSDAIINTVRYSGVVSMACHGTGRDTRTIPDYIVGLQWVDAEGSLQERTRDTADAIEFNCLVAGLGLLGVITSITFQLDAQLDRPYVDVEHVFKPMGKALASPEDFRKLVESNYAVELFWMPLNSADPGLHLGWDGSNWNPQEDDAWIIKFKERVAAKREDVLKFENRVGVLERTQTELGAIASKLAQEKGSLLLQAWQGKFTTVALKANLVVPGGFLDNGTQTLARAIHYQKAITAFKVYDVEVCFPVAEDFGNVLAAWKVAVDIATAEIKKGRRNVMNVALECRFTRASEAILSPAYSTTHTGWFCWIEVLAAASTPLDAWLAFVEKVFDAWRAIQHPGPVKLHWAKWTDFEGTRGKVEARLAEKMRKHTQVVFEDQLKVFREVAGRMDPQGRFGNQWLTDLFKLPSGATPLQPASTAGAAA